MPVVSVLLPAYNEAENLPEVLAQLADSLDRLAAAGTVDGYEVVVVDDGSSDGTRGVLHDLQDDHPWLRACRLRRNAGKSAALQVGLRQVKGDVVVLMDADGQDDPDAIGTLLGALDGGLDLVTGRRSERRDRFVKRRTSRLYNRVTAWVTGVPGRDFNSGLKAMRRTVADCLDVYGELHRYIPVLAHWAGFRVGEVDVPHRPRLHGRSKFGRARFWRGFLDLLTVKFLTTYTGRPFHLFGGVGIVTSLVGAAMLAWMAVVKIGGHAIGTRPALITGVLLVVVGVQLMSLGLIAELVLHLRSARGPEAWVDEL
jgi:glycosyltransferase involved in cell wall biosynthesis